MDLVDASRASDNPCVGAPAVRTHRRRPTSEVEVVRLPGIPHEVRPTHTDQGRPRVMQSMRTRDRVRPSCARSLTPHRHPTHRSITPLRSTAATHASIPSEERSPSRLRGRDRECRRFASSTSSRSPTGCCVPNARTGSAILPTRAQRRVARLRWPRPRREAVSCSSWASRTQTSGIQASHETRTTDQVPSGQVARSDDVRASADRQI
ncbi:MAG: hypothetical protein QOI55_2208 [Actinomycetota bacterium]|nr:hypothetical protein [Actinomycetota bacterium]